MFSLSLSLARRRNRSVGLIALGCGFFMVLLDSTVLNVALPTIERTLGGSLESLQWTVNSYTLLFASLLLTGGALADRYGARRIFSLGLLIFSGASLLCSLSINITMLISARVVQGIGAAILLPASLSLIAHLFTEPKERARAVSVWVGIASLAVASGPFIGGTLVDTLGWCSVFLVNLPCGGLALLLTFLNITPTPQKKNHSLDLTGQVLATVACCTFTYGLIEWGHVATPLIAASFLVSVLAGATFGIIEARTAQSMLPLSLLRPWNVSAALLIGLIYQFSFYGLLFIFALFFQNAYHFSAFRTGLAFLPLTTVGSFLLLFVTGRLMRRFRSSALLIVGMMAGCVGMLLLILGIHTTFLVIIAGEVLVSCEAGLVAAPIAALVLTDVPKEQSGIASALLNAARQIGGVLGVALLGAALGNNSSIVGMQIAILITALACFAGLLLSISLARYGGL